MNAPSLVNSRPSWTTTSLWLFFLSVILAIFWLTNLVYVKQVKKRLDELGVMMSSNTKLIFDINALLSDFSLFLIPLSVLFFLGVVVLFRHVLSLEKIGNAFALISCIGLLVSFNVIFFNTSHIVGKVIEGLNKT